MIVMVTGLKYLELTKPKVTLLNLFVGATCFVLAEFPFVNWFFLILFLLVGYLAAGGCGAVNCYLDRDIDGLMERTSSRAVPSGKILPKNALSFGVALISGSLAIGFVVFGIPTFLMLSLGVISYILVYTVLVKRATKWNVVIGGVAGSFAAFSGWVATGQNLSLIPIFVGLLDFLWTPGHLWGLAMKSMKEYKKAQIPMLPVILGLKKTSMYIFIFDVATIGSSLLFPLLGLTGMTYLVIATVANVFLLNENRMAAKSIDGETRVQNILDLHAISS